MKVALPLVKLQLAVRERVMAWTDESVLCRKEANITFGIVNHTFQRDLIIDKGLHFRCGFKTAKETMSRGVEGNDKELGNAVWITFELKRDAKNVKWY